jgi:transcriptional regulator with PAS, ATPase and Fis domain
MQEEPFYSYKICYGQPRMNVLISWVGETDLRAAKGEPSAGIGPIGLAVKARAFDRLVLLCNYKDRKADVAHFAAWLGETYPGTIDLRHQSLETPTDYAGIYRSVTAVLSALVAKFTQRPSLTFHLSPGTPAMAAVWILVAPKYNAKLIQTSRERGLEDANIPFEIAAEFVPSLVRSVDADLERLSDGLRPEAPEFTDIVHRSEAMKRLIHRAKLAAPYSAPILIEGESGTGKELFAAAIHRASGRNGNFVAVNCGALPKELVESAFFGHKKGAFTGAISDQAGYFEKAHGGTLFLDEVGELPLEAQVKLLRVLQERKVQRIGESREVSVDVRIVAATNRDLLAQVASHAFREDLYFRLATLVLRTPALREREGDVGLLAERFLAKINQEEASRIAGGKKKLSTGAKKLLLTHSWPGNVRELQATLLRAVVWSKGATVEESDLREALVSSASHAAAGSRGSSREILHQPLGNGFSLQDSLAEVARHYLKRAVKESNGNKTKAADLVGFSNYQTLSNWLRKYGVDG